MAIIFFALKDSHFLNSHRLPLTWAERNRWPHREYTNCLLKKKSVFWFYFYPLPALPHCSTAAFYKTIIPHNSLPHHHWPALKCHLSVRVCITKKRKWIGHICLFVSWSTWPHLGKFNTHNPPPEECFCSASTHNTLMLHVCVCMRERERDRERGRERGRERERERERLSAFNVSKDTFHLLVLLLEGCIFVWIWLIVVMCQVAHFIGFVSFSHKNTRAHMHSVHCASSPTVLFIF